MASNPRENKEYYGIIVDRDGPDNSCKVFIPELHGRDVKVEHLGWSRFTVPPGQGGATTSYGTPDNGQMVKCMVNTTGGSMLVQINSLLQTKQSSEPAKPGNFSLNFLPQWANAVARELPVRVRPDIEEVVENGRKIRRAKEKGIKHKHELLKELNSTGAVYPLNGTILPSITIETATQSAIMSITAELQEALPGVGLALGGILDLLPSEVLDSIPPTVLTGFQNMSSLMTSLTPIAMGGTQVNIDKIDPVSFALNAAELLSGAQSIDDVVSALGDLATNTALQGLGGIAGALTSVIDSPFGQITQIFNPLTGLMESIIPDEIAQAAAAFSGLMGSLPSAGGVPLFGDAFETMNAMAQRLPASMQGRFKDIMEQNVSTSLGNDVRKKLNELGGATNVAALGYKKMFEKFGVV